MSGDWSRRSVYRARSRRPRQWLALPLAALALAAVWVAVARGEGGDRVVYDRAAATAYADRWALTVNPHYWSSRDHDCANFVSQCVAAGGLRPVDVAGGWHDNGRAYPSLAWVNCEAQRRAWSGGGADSSPYIVASSSRLPGDWAAGDVVYLGNVTNGRPEWQHVIICVGKKRGHWLYDSHTVAYRRQPLSVWYPAHFSLIRFYHLADEVAYR